jgi:hypothetical protein
MNWKLQPKVKRWKLVNVFFYYNVCPTFAHRNSYSCDALSKLIFTGAGFCGTSDEGTSLYKPVTQ